MYNYSYHIFYHPFRWNIPGSEHLPFDRQVDLSRITFNKFSEWERISLPKNEDLPSLLNCESVRQEFEELYDEKNYYYPFVHPILYDSGVPGDLVYHFERKEPKNGREVLYRILLINKKDKTEKEYILKVDAINVNLYGSGVGVLSFFLCNNRKEQSESKDILNINQFGRRIMPAFFSDKEKRSLIADSIRITGLNGDAGQYREDFTEYGLHDTWKAACFITALLNDLSAELETIPVIDDRMYVNCWYGNDDLEKKYVGCPEAQRCRLKCDPSAEEKRIRQFTEGDFWYQYVFIDHAGDTCQNRKMKAGLLEDATYLRWQKYGTLYGNSRYSFVALTGTSGEFIPTHMRTIYSRMAELCLVQRASMLRFSAEVTNLSHLKQERKNKLSSKISALYKLYIRFINQIYFRDITAQDQGIELYRLFRKNMDIDKHVKDLDGEIEELHRYVTFTEEHAMNKQMAYLTVIATIFLPVTLVTGFFGMNALDTLLLHDKCPYGLYWQIGIILFSLLIAWLAVILLKKRYK